MSGQTCLMKVIVHIGKVSRYCFLMCLLVRVMSVFLTPQSYHSEVWDNHFVWSILNSRNKLKHFYGNTLVWQWHTTSWNESFKSLAGVEKSITGFWDGGSYRKVFGKWKDCWRSGFADTVLACLYEVLGGCDNSNSPLPGNGNSLFCCQFCI